VTAPGWRDRLRNIGNHPVARILAVFAVSRAVLLLVLIVLREAPLAEPITRSVAEMFCYVDCQSYLDLASVGYSIESLDSRDATDYAYYPLYPMLVGLLSSVTGLSPLISGIALSNTFFAGALMYVFFYSRDLGFSYRTGMLAVTLLAFSPPTIVFSSLMTEALFVLLLAAAAFHLRRGEFVRAGVAAALVSATRATGIAFLAFALIWIFRRYGVAVFLRPWMRPQVFVPVILAPLGLFAFWTFSFVTTGDAFASISTSIHGWGWGVQSAAEQLSLFTRLDTSDQLLIGISALSLALSLLLLRYRLYEDFGLCVVTLAIIWTGGLAAWSMPRFALALFPLAIVLARSVASRPGLATVLVAAAATVNGFVLVVAWAMRAFVI
jgi:hypothetical protein